MIRHHKILTYLGMFFICLNSFKSKNKEILTTLVKHLFDYKIITRIREESEEQLQVIFCDECECNHGLPDELRKLIVQIRHRID